MIIIGVLLVLYLFYVLYGGKIRAEIATRKQEKKNRKELLDKELDRAADKINAYLKQFEKEDYSGSAFIQYDGDIFKGNEDNKDV